MEDRRKKEQKLSDYGTEHAEKQASLSSPGQIKNVYDVELGELAPSSVTRTRFAWWCWGYALDWCLLVSVTLIELAIVHLAVSPYDRYLRPGSPVAEFDYPYLPDIVRARTLVISATHEC